MENKENDFENEYASADAEKPEEEKNPDETQNPDGIKNPEDNENGDGHENDSAGTPPRDEDPYAFRRSNMYVPDNYGYRQNPPKPKKNDFFSNKGLALLISLCLVFSILTGVCVNAINKRNSESGTSAPSGSTPALVQTTSGTPSGTQATQTPALPVITDFNAVPEFVISATAGTALTDEEICTKNKNSIVIIRSTYANGSGAASGVIYSSDGYIVTNYHVANEDCLSLTVTLFSGEEYPAQYVYGDEQSDIAVIKIDKNDCQPVTVGNSADMKMGASCVVIGNPLGLGIAATSGIISAEERKVTIENTTMLLMQTDAAVNEGNSGGGLFNKYGQLIGIVNAKVGGTTVDNTGYAIPTTAVMKAVNDLKKYGYVTGKARLGITVNTISDYIIGTYIQVQSVSENGSAAGSGLQVNDMLMKFEGEDITSFAILTEKLTKYKVGDTVKLTVYRPTGSYEGKSINDCKSYNEIFSYVRSCEEIDITVTFREFNPNK